MLEELFIEEEYTPEPRGPIVLSASEQETVINFGRTDSYATISTSDNTMKTKLDKMVEISDAWECTGENGPVKFYKVKDKTLISYRKNKSTREMTDEQKQAAAERLMAARKANYIK